MSGVSEVKKLVSVLTISTSIADARKEALKCVSYIHFLVQFEGTNKTQAQALIDSGSEVNVMTPAYKSRLGLRAHHTNVEAQKIDDSTLQTFEIVLADFQVEDKLGKARFFQETFLLADISTEIVLGMPFLTLSNANIQFVEKKHTWRSYTTAEALPTTKQVKLINKKEFAKVALDENSETFVVHVASLSSTPLDVHPSQRPQISSLIAEKALTKVPDEYANFADVFSLDLAAKLLKYTGINDYAIKLVDGQQLLYRPIYSLGPVELKTLKAYIETNLANGFIRPSMSPADTPILFDRKSNGSFRLCVDYQGLNNLTIKNWYPLPLIGESVDRLGRARRFIQLDFTNAYYQIRIRKGDKWKTAFRTRYGYFKYQVIPFGLTNAPASFTGCINKILVEKFDIFVIVYLDDILIYTNEDGDDHIAAV